MGGVVLAFVSFRSLGSGRPQPCPKDSNGEIGGRASPRSVSMSRDAGAGRSTDTAARRGDGEKTGKDKKETRTGKKKIRTDKNKTHTARKKIRTDKNKTRTDKNKTRTTRDKSRTLRRTSRRAASEPCAGLARRLVAWLRVTSRWGACLWPS